MSPSPPPPALALVDGQAINLADARMTLERVGARLASGEGFKLFTLNLDHLVKRRRDPAFAAAYRAADFITADGEPVAALARRQAADIRRTTGADLVVPLARLAAARGLPVFLYGARAETLAAAARQLEALCPGLRIAGMRSPSMDFDPLATDAPTLARAMTASGAALCFLALGAPKQEILAHRLAPHARSIGFVACGGALDFLAGTAARAPAIWQRWHVEWLWRLSCEPLRLAPRYARCAWLWADLTIAACRRPDVSSRPAE